MSKRLFVGISGKARHGKDSVARAIHEAYPETTEIMRSADGLKAYCRVALGMTTKDAPLLQRVGLEFRQKDPDFWLKILASTAEESAAPTILVPDVRFRNEAAFIREQGGWLVRVERLTSDGRLYVAGDRPADHISEVDLDDYRGWDGVFRCVKLGELQRMAVEWFNGQFAPFQPEIEVSLATMPVLPGD